MKKLAVMMSLFCLLLLAACGTDSGKEVDQDSNQSSGETTTNTNENTNNNEDTDATTDEDANNNEDTDITTDEDTNNNEDTDTTTDENVDDSAAPSEEQLTYQLNGEMIKETASLTNSDNQGYSMYVLPNFTLTGEEPRKDTLYVNNADQNFMRIELLPDDVDWEQYEQNIAVELEYYNSDITEPTDANLQMDNASIFEASNGEELATIYLIKDEKQPMKLTMFTKADQDYRSAFVEMAKTIVKDQ